jgi:tagatose 1,6-diphosphate aldolase
LSGVTFQFLKTGPLVDGELELVAPARMWMDPLLAACADPLTQRDAPRDARTTREQLIDFLKAAPGGLQPPDARRGYVPQYHFWMRVRDSVIQDKPPVVIAGGIGLRVGTTPAIEMYYGHIGYNVYPPARGRHFAERACRLLLPLARSHGLDVLWITCNPDNLASRRTCERLGMTLVDIVSVPPSEPLYARGDREKCRYRLRL